MLKKCFSWLVLSLLVLGTSWALFHPEFFRVHDYVHGARVGEMALALSEGQLPVRWSSNFGYGYGMPLFEFYAPLPFYIGAGLYLLGLDLILTLKLLWLGCAIFTAWGGYKLGTSLYGRSGGILTAAALTMAPYRALNLYVRGALSEGFGIMALPWILYGIVLVVRKKSGGWLILSLAVAVLALSHNLTTLMFVPLSAVFAGGLLLIERARFASIREWLLQAAIVAGSYLLGIGLAAFYIFPALVEKDATKVARILGGYFDYRLHFLYIRQLITPFWGYGGSGWGPQDDISFFLGFGQLLSLILVAGLAMWWVVKRRRLHFHTQRLLLVTGLLGIALFMTLVKSQPVWEALPFLSFIQFPWRWLSGATVFLSLMAGSVMAFISRRWLRYLVAVGLSLVMLVGNISYFRPESYLDDASSLYYTDPTRIQNHMSNILNDYVPQQMPEQLIPPQSLVTGDPQQVTRLALLVNRSHQKLWRTDFTQSTTLDIQIANFPGWQAELDGQPLAISTSPQGTLIVVVPAGEHLLGVVFGRTPIRAISDSISLIAGISLMCLLAFRYQSAKITSSS